MGNKKRVGRRTAIKVVAGVFSIILSVIGFGWTVSLYHDGWFEWNSAHATLPTVRRWKGNGWSVLEFSAMGQALVLGDDRERFLTEAGELWNEEVRERIRRGREKLLEFPVDPSLPPKGDLLNFGPFRQWHPLRDYSDDVPPDFPEGIPPIELSYESSADAALVNELLEIAEEVIKSRAQRGKIELPAGMFGEPSTELDDSE